MGIASVHTDDYRYPGTKFFEPGQQNIFFGREQETRDLVYSLKAYDVFVIFADSGIGKTSMLNAALIPELEKENYEAIKFRFQDVAIPPLQIIKEKLADYYDPEKIIDSSGEVNLWRLFKSCDFNSRMPIFIFDQFEEFFNHTKINRENCIDEWAGLINEYLPDSIRDEMRIKFRENDPTPEQLKYYSPARVKLLFLIRADKLKLLDDLSHKIPFILKNRFYLRPLTGKQAEQAILLPALLPKNGFASPSFNYEEEAVTDICNYLKNGEGEVESFQLQILCRELEKRIISRSENKEKGLWIRKEELGGETGMDSITKNYYTNQIAAIPDGDLRAKAVALIEDKLIVEGRRISLPEILLIKEGYSKELLDYLLNTTRIIRAYNDRNSRYYEISHDRLLPSILALKQQRQEEKSGLDALSELKRLRQVEEIKNAELSKEKNIKKRFRIFSVAMALLCVVLLFSFVHIIHLDTNAKIANAGYFNALQRYDTAAQILRSQNIFSIFNFAFKDTLDKISANTQMHIKNRKIYTDNINKANALITFYKATSPVAESLIRTALDNKNQSRQFKISTDVSNALMKALTSDSLLKARNFYSLAQRINFKPLDDSSKVEYKLIEIDNYISESFGQNIYAILIYLKSKMNPEAVRVYKKTRLIQSAAYTPPINLKPEARCVLDSLQNILKQ